MPAEIREQFERERSEHRRMVRQQKSGLPELYLTGRLSFESFSAADGDAARALHYCRIWSRSRLVEKKSIYLCGSVGIGKSHLAQSAIAAALAYSPARFITRVDLVHAVQSAFADDTMSEEAALRPFVTIDRLAIDDLDKGRVTEHVLKTLWAIVDTRSRNELATIFTANSTPNQLYEHLAIPGSEITAESIVDRILGMCEVIDLRGQSHRRSA